MNMSSRQNVFYHQNDTSKFFPLISGLLIKSPRAHEAAHCDSQRFKGTFPIDLYLLVALTFVMTFWIKYLFMNTFKFILLIPLFLLSICASIHPVNYLLLFSGPLTLSDPELTRN